MNSPKNKLNNAQQQAVDHKDGPIMVVAGAGTGKTKVIVERIVRLINSGVKPESILALTFTEKAAAEMLDRVNDLRGGYTLDATITTYNGFGNDLLKEFAAEIGLSNNLQLLGETGQLVFLREHLDDLELEYYSPISQPDSQLENIAGYISKLKQQLITPVAYIKYANDMPATTQEESLDKTKHSELANVYNIYIKLCRQRHVIDYDDQLYLTHELLQKRPNILKELQDRYKYILVDEFQDTNPMQSIILDQLAGKAQNLMVVGDDDQSIYGWRGATLANILDFTKRYKQTKQITLTQNYRSTQSILDTAYQLIQANNPQRLEHMYKLDKRLQSNTQTGSKPQVQQFTHINAELQWIATDITRRIAAGQDPGTIAVLGRRNHGLGQVHEALESANIEHVVAGVSSDLYRQPAVTNLLEALKAVNDPADYSALYHVLGGPLFNIDAAVLAEAASQARKHHQALTEQFTDNKDAVAALGQLATWRTQVHNKSVGQLAYAILSDTGWKKTLYADAQKDEAAATQAQALGQFFNTLKEFERISDVPSNKLYLENLPALKAAGNTLQDGSMESSTQVVNVLSIHKAKGLEWDTVYVFDCTKGSLPMRAFPSAMSIPTKLLTHTAADEHINEERRLMYVAATRAKNDLVLTYSDTHTGKTKRQPSPFLNELLGNDFTPNKHGEDVSLGKTIESFAATSSKVGLPASMQNDTGLVLSASQVDAYLRCPVEFYYRYVLQVPQPDIPALKYGSLVHGFIERVHKSIKSGKVVAYQDLLDELKDIWPQAGYTSAAQRERAHSSGKKALAKLYKRLLTEDVPTLIEQPFRVKVPNANLTLIGRIDAVYNADTNAEICDYKTGTSVTTPDKAKKRAQASAQLNLYALAWQIMHGELPALLTLDFVETNQKGSVKKQAKTLDNLQLKLADMVKNIKAGNYTPAKDHTYCTHPL